MIVTVDAIATSAYPPSVMFLIAERKVRTPGGR
jgi:hypothetical protein